MIPFIRAAAPFALAAALLAPLPALASGKTSLVLGLGMTFGHHVAPEFYTGLEHTNTNASGDVSGAKALFYWDFAQSLAPSKLKVLGILGGKKNWQPEIGAGYSFENRNGLFSAGINSHHLAGGVEFSPTAGLSPYFQVHTGGDY